MINHVKIFLNDGTKFTELSVDGKNIKKMFFDQDDKSTLIVLYEDHIETYSGFLYVCLKDYKEVK